MECSICGQRQIDNIEFHRLGKKYICNECYTKYKSCIGKTAEETLYSIAHKLHQEVWEKVIKVSNIEEDIDEVQELLNEVRLPIIKIQNIIEILNTDVKYDIIEQLDMIQGILSSVSVIISDRSTIQSVWLEEDEDE